MARRYRRPKRDRLAVRESEQRVRADIRESEQRVRADIRASEQRQARVSRRQFVQTSAIATAGIIIAELSQQPRIVRNVQVSGTLDHAVRGGAPRIMNVSARFVFDVPQVTVRVVRRV